jgi:hypothetical protein
MRDVAKSPRWRPVAYWITTLYIALESAVAGTMDILRPPPLFATHLGYPDQFGRIR